MCILRHRATAFLYSVTFTVSATAATAQSSPVPTADSATIASYQRAADSLIRAATRDSSAYGRLGALVDRFPARLSGSTNLEAAIDWVLAEMRKDNLENVRGEPVMVPHWVRGEESAELVKPRPQKLRILGLGMSTGTPKAGITAPVLVVSSFEELNRRTAEAKGKIVLFDAPFTTYGETGRYRRFGATAAARAGAVAVLIRSVADYSMQTPHTGTMNDSTPPGIPAAALSVEDAMMLHRMQDRRESVVLTLRMGAHRLPDAKSRNVVAEIAGRERPDEVVVLGGHIDSWDAGQGAMDDGGGSVAAWEALRLMRELGLRPRRTVRVVLWTNEENGFAGALGYRDAHAAQLSKHVLAMESDNGVFKPYGFSFNGSDSMYAVMRQVAKLLRPIQADSVERTTGSPADIRPLVARGVPGVEPAVDGSRYFWFHHSDADTLDKLDPADMARNVALMAVLAYVVADLPQ